MSKETVVYVDCTLGSDPKDTEDYLLDNWGICTRPSKDKNQCYWGNDGCLRTGWVGRLCPYWKPSGAKTYGALMSIEVE